LVAETTVSSADFIAPLFVAEGLSAPRPISSLPGQFQHTVDSLLAEVDELLSVGVTSLILFGVPSSKDATGSQAWAPEGICQVATRAIAERFGDDLVIMNDLCLDEYTEHGHCGVLDARGDVDNDATIALYGQIAVAQARAGAHVVAPSGMMDGQIAAIRRALDAEGFGHIPILAYSAKYASALYGPFREAVGVEIAGGGHRRGYQQDPANIRESLREIRLDLHEGADMVMVKPAMTNLDVIAAARREVDVPVFAYHVSGEYAMIHAAGERGWIDPLAVAREQLLSLRRAGADGILTYFAKDLARSMS
jgi:porphobilinogen synthase